LPRELLSLERASLSSSERGTISTKPATKHLLFLTVSTVRSYQKKVVSNPESVASSAGHMRSEIIVGVFEDVGALAAAEVASSFD
jgi:hypothetical protein